MAFYADVLPGSDFKPSAGLSNDVRHLLNGLNGFHSGAFGANNSGTVRIQVYNSTSTKMDAGSAVNFASETRMADNAVPAVRFRDLRKPWGVLLSKLGQSEMGDCVISGPVRVNASGSGDFAVPSLTEPRQFIRGYEGVPVLYSHSGKALINLCITGQKILDTPFAPVYNPEDGLVHIGAGYLTRNGEFLQVPAGSVALEEGYICLCTSLGEEGAWTEPVYAVTAPGMYSYPVAMCRICSAGSTDRNIYIHSFNVPVAVFLSTGECSKKAPAEA